MQLDLYYISHFDFYGNQDVFKEETQLIDMIPRRSKNPSKYESLILPKSILLILAWRRYVMSCLSAAYTFYNDCGRVNAHTYCPKNGMTPVESVWDFVDMVNSTDLVC